MIRIWDCKYIYDVNYDYIINIWENFLTNQFLIHFFFLKIQWRIGFCLFVNKVYVICELDFVSQKLIKLEFKQILELLNNKNLIKKKSQSAIEF